MNQHQNNQLQLTVLMPCRNEEGSVGLCTEEALLFMADHGIRGEVLVVDNGSDDASARVAADAGARVVYESRPGYGSALGRGIAEAWGEFTIMGDADGEYPFSEMLPFWELLASGDYDFVIGNRTLSAEEAGASTFLNRYVGAPALSMMGRVLFGTGVGDFHCGLRGFNTQAARDLGMRSTGMEFASEMVARFVVTGARIPPDLPVRKRRAFDPERTPHLRRWRDGFRHINLMLGLFWQLRVLRRR